MPSAQTGIRLGRPGQLAAAWLLAAMALFPAYSQTPSPVVLNRVIAAVNGQAILESDLEDEMRLSVLEPSNRQSGTETPPEALERLIGRTLIRQQIRDEDEQSLTPTDKQVADRVILMRAQLPVCAQAACVSDAGWKTFLDAHQLTESQVNSYVRDRMEMLRFIEMRFRLGIHVSPEQIRDYYRNTLLPEYGLGEAAPPLDQVSARIEEILLQQQVTGLFGGWLDNLRSQGDIEVLDPSLETSPPNHAPVNPSQGVR
ncbi:MAG: peptidylprolyl isomerase [Terracidiphilus sp.]